MSELGYRPPMATGPWWTLAVRIDATQPYPKVLVHRNELALATSYSATLLVGFMSRRTRNPRPSGVRGRQGEPRLYPIIGFGCVEAGALARPRAKF